MGTGQSSVAVRNAKLEAERATIGVNAVVRIYSGTKPADCATATGGGNVMLAQGVAAGSGGILFSPASGGAMSLAVPLQTAAAAATGVPSFARVFDSTGTTCHRQTDIGTSGTGLTMSVLAITAGNTYTFNGWTITEGDA